MLKTRLTERYGVKHPFAQAGMAFAGEKPELAQAVGQGGGIGAIGVGFLPPDELREHIAKLRDAGKPFNINFITCFGNDEQVKTTAGEKVPVASFHWGLPPDDQVKMLKDSGADIWVQVGTVEDGEKAVELGADLVVAQGWEAGGHNYGGMGSMALVPAMVDAIGDKAMVLASGGITDGRGVAASLALGADGVWVGTRLVATNEAWVHPEHHTRLVAACGADTTRSGVFGPEMPDFNPMRLMRVRPTEEFEGRLEDVPKDRANEPVIGQTQFLGQPHEKRRFDVILPTPDTTGDYEEMAWLMGQGVGLIKDIQPAAEIVEEMMADAARILGAAQ
ncbi:nitronate monooxygenase [uncultured Ruegeria sp.]|uniref:NAD(P)H-dependent flavin oxidoreductase n=1 Tax=uncultured Ruegeria sp. TaxID=259304 RepID=UPI00260BB263|nr:nitronate monooxygenase [uncultured Ruegeria sp.]